MKDFTNISEVQKYAIALSGPTDIYWPQFKTFEVYEPLLDGSAERCYYSNNGIISFISNNVQYVIPNISNVREILKKDGFENKAMYVPFSNWSCPVEEKDRWYNLLLMRKNRY